MMAMRAAKRSAAWVATSAMAAASVASGALGCSRSSGIAEDAGRASVDAAAWTTNDAAPAAPVPVTQALGHTRPPPPPCRVIAVAGAASQPLDGGVAQALSVGVPVPSWLELTDAARVTVKEPSSGRELLFVGPASAVPCVAESQAWLARGTLSGTRGSGEKPGAEQWVVTPSAVVRYGGAFVDVTVAPDGTHVVLKGGSATAIADGDDTWRPLDPKVRFFAPLAPSHAATPAPRADAAPPNDRCARTSADASALEAQLLSPGETRDPGFGELAKRTTEARILAQATCAMSALRAATRTATPSP